MAVAPHGNISARQFSFRFLLLSVFFSFLLARHVNNIISWTDYALSNTAPDHNGPTTTTTTESVNNWIGESLKSLQDSINNNLNFDASSQRTLSSEEDDDDDDEQDRPSSDEPLNVVFLYADDWTFKTLGKVNPYVITPNIDRLADQGILFTHSCVTTSICWMSRGTLVTGQYSSRHKAFTPSDMTLYDDWNNTLYQKLADAGIYNGFFGKWHNGMNNTLLKQAMPERSFYYGHHWLRPGRHITEQNEEDALNFLKRKKWGDKPFTLTVSFFATHAQDGSEGQYYPQNTSMQYYNSRPVPTPKNNDTFKQLPSFITERCEARKRYHQRYHNYTEYQHHMKNMYRMATEVDIACGKIIRELQRQDLLKKTLVIFTTDNGNFHSEHGLAEKWFPHEESIRVPLVVWDPRLPKSKRGIVNDDYVLSIDLAPTILKAAGVEVPSTMQGRDFSDLYLKQDVDWRTEWYYEWPRPSIFPPYYLPKAEALVRKDYKYMFWEDYNSSQLYHVAEDPMEERNLLTDAQSQTILEEMKVAFEFRKEEAIGENVAIKTL